MQDIHKKRPTCFLSASTEADIDKVMTLLQQKKVRVITLMELPMRGQTITERIKSAMLNADFVLAIININGLSKTNESIYFEIGYATALGKHTIVVLPESEMIPAILKGTLIIRADINNLEAVEFAVDQVLNKLSSQKPQTPYTDQLKSRRFRPDVDDAPILRGISGSELNVGIMHHERSTGSQTHKDRRIISKYNNGIGTKVDKYINRLNELGDRSTEVEIENMIVEALKESGISIVRQSGNTEGAPDIAVWVDELGARSNPVLIEVNKFIDNNQRAERIKDQLTKYLSQIGARFAIVLYDRGFQKIYLNPILESFIYFLNVQDFLERLRSRSFGEVIRDINKTRYKEAND